MVNRKGRKVQTTINKNIAHITRDGKTSTPQKTVCEVRCSRRVGSSCSTSTTRRIMIDTKPVISHERGKDGKCVRQVEHIRGHLRHSYSVAVNKAMVANVNMSK